MVSRKSTLSDLMQRIVFRDTSGFCFPPKKSLRTDFGCRSKSAMNIEHYTSRQLCIKIQTSAPWKIGYLWYVSIAQLFHYHTSLKCCSHLHDNIPSLAENCGFHQDNIWPHKIKQINAKILKSPFNHSKSLDFASSENVWYLIRHNMFHILSLKLEEKLLPVGIIWLCLSQGNICMLISSVT